MSVINRAEESGKPFEREELPVINPSFIPEPGYDSIGDTHGREEYPSYQEPVPIDKPSEIGENSVKEF